MLDGIYTPMYICVAMHGTVLRALADPTRLRIVEALRSGEHAVNDIVAKVGIHQSGVSRHLLILHDAGFVRVRPDGPKRLYSLRPQPFRELDAWVTRFRSSWEARFDKLAGQLDRRGRARAATRTA